LGKINVAIIGVGNCASSLIQGVYYYKQAKETDFVPGLMHVNLGGYHISLTIPSNSVRCQLQGLRFSEA